MSNNVKCYLCKNVSEYLDIIKKIKAEQDYYYNTLWFRGHECSEYRLMPSGLRERKVVLDARGNPTRRGDRLNSEGTKSLTYDLKGMLDEFKQKSIPYLDKFPENDLEWMFLAQHHGLPTKLLDWTINPLVSLYFAVAENNIDKSKFRYLFEEDLDENNLMKKEARDEDIKENNIEFLPGCASVYIINPYKVNEVLNHGNRIVNILEDKKYIDYIDEGDGYDLEPICISSKSIDKRIVAQSGYFTIHGSMLWPIDYYEVVRQHLYKILIPYEYIDTFKNELELLGIDKMFIYPGLDSLAECIKVNEKLRFPKRIEKFYELHGV